jgi:hypothetical protein
MPAEQPMQPIPAMQPAEPMHSTAPGQRGTATRRSATCGVLATSAERSAVRMSRSWPRRCAPPSVLTFSTWLSCAKATSSRQKTGDVVRRVSPGSPLMILTWLDLIDARPARWT